MNDAAADEPEEVETFRPVNNPSRLERHIDKSHDANAVLHDVLKAAAKDDDAIASVNLIADHQRPGHAKKYAPEPDYAVRVKAVNEGMGHPVIGDTVIGDLMDGNKVSITGIGETSSDHVVVFLRPKVTETRPVEVRYEDVPDDFVHIDDLWEYAGRALEASYRKEGPMVAPAVARSIASVIRLANPPEIQRGEYQSGDFMERLQDEAGVDVGTNDPSPPDDYEVEYIQFNGSDDTTRAIEHTDVKTKADAVNAAKALLDEYDAPLADVVAKEIREEYDARRKNRTGVR